MSHFTTLETKTQLANEDRPCKRADIIMQCSLNQEWSVTRDGGIDNFLGDVGGGCRFSNYLCENCCECFEEWYDALQHLTKVAA
jgi:hypothetical protein